MDLDAPLLTQFWIWVKGAVTGDFGTSITLHLYVTEVLASRLPATLELAVSALLVAIVLGGSIAIAGTLMRRTVGETLIDGLNSIMLAVPDFIWALALVLLFAVAIPILPLTGRIDPELAEGFRHADFIWPKASSPAASRWPATSSAIWSCRRWRWRCRSPP